MKKWIFIPIICFIFIGCASFHAEKKAQETLFYPPLPQQPRLQYLCSISGEHDLGKQENPFLEFLLGNPQYKNLGKPYDVGASAGRIYVVDRMYGKIVILDLARQSMSFLDDHGAGSIGDPSGIWVGNEDVIYVADMQRKQVVAYNPDGDFLMAYGSKAIFEKPVDVAVSENRVYVIDIEKHQLFIMDKDSGELIKTVGQKGRKNGEFFKPTHVTVDSAGNIFVNDAFNFRLQKLNPEGEFIDTIGFHGDRPGGFARPKGLAVDRENHLYAVDAAFENVQIFDDDHRLLLYFGGGGTGPGALYLPAGIAVDYQNIKYFDQFVDPNFRLTYLVYVTSSFGRNKLTVYGFGQWVGDTLP